MKVRMIFAGLLLGAAITLQAQVTIGGSVDMSVVPFQFVEGLGYESGTMGAGIGGVLQNNGPRIRLDARAVNEEHRIGMRARFQFTAPTGNMALGGENFLQAWWSPLDWLRVDVGRFDDDRLRGRIGDDEMGMFTNMMFGPDQIFNRFRVRSGMMLSTTPVEGLLLAGALRELVNYGGGAATATTTPGEVNTVANRHVNGDAWRNMTFAMGYTIPDIGLIRVQYIGDVTGGAAIEKNNNVELAFALTAIDGLLLDLGAKLHFVYAMDDPNFAFSLGARFRADALEIIGRVDTQIGRVLSAADATYHPTYALSNNLLRLNAHIWPSFQLDAARVILNFGVDFTEMPGNVDNRTDIGLGLSLQRNFIGNTRVRGGVAVALPTDNNRPMIFSVPLFLEYSF